ncbi:YopX family protein [Campylobacter coli]|uniref:YopX family protein n=1 Tax=Campylobacter coli TaxID=195 RepID=UPI000A98EF86|nr:YopX family protein [Campylobacter coli]
MLIKGPYNVVLSSYSDNERINFEGYDRKFEVELFTRLYDKNGKKVYENDIVKAKNPFNCLEAKISIHKEGTFYLENKSGHYMGSLIYLVELSLQNSFFNPTLKMMRLLLCV